MTWMVAPSYAKAEIRTVNEETHKAYIVEKCDRCGGTGWWGNLGTCYKCNGAGKLGKWVKAYTEEEYEKYVAAQERAKERRIEKEAARKQALIDNSDENKAALLTSFGYDATNPQVYIVFGENTYAIKDELKAAGARYDKVLGWYFTHETEVPAGYELLSIPFDDIYEWFPVTKRIELKDSAKEIVDKLLEANTPESPSDYVGDVKQRIRDMDVVLTGSRQIDGYYGISTIFTFNYNDNILTWITSSCPDIEIGDHVFLTGTVKEHKLYKGVKQTILSRCIVRKGSVS